MKNERFLVERIAVEVPLTKKTCRDSKGKTLKHDERSPVKLCAGTKYEQRMYTCNDGKLKLGATVVLGKCGDGRSGGALVY